MLLFHQNRQRIRTVLILCLLLIVNSLFSQTREDTIAKIISYGLSVYAKDRFTYDADERKILNSIINNRIQDNYKLISYLKNNYNLRINILGRIVEDWIDKSRSFNNANSYSILVSTIENRLYSGGNGVAKMWRRENVPILFTAPVKAYLGLSNKAVDSAINREYANSNASKKSDEIDNGPILTTAGGHDMIAIMALFFSGLSFLGVIAILFYLGGKQRKGSG